MEGRGSRTTEKFCEANSDQVCKKLEECGVFFESDNFTPIESKRIFHIIAEDGTLVLIAGGPILANNALLAKLERKSSQRRSGDTVTLQELFDTGEATKLVKPAAKIVFRRKESVILMLDGIDEALPDHLFAEWQDVPHISRMVVVLTVQRPHMTRRYTLEPLTHKSLKDFFETHWTNHLRKHKTSKKKWESYVTKLVKEVFPPSLDGHLGAKLLQELFEWYTPRDESKGWASCSEYLRPGGTKSKLTRQVAEMFEYFIQETQYILNEVPFNRTPSQVLDHLYEAHLACQRTLAEDKEEQGLFISNRQIKNLEVAMLKVEFVQKLYDKLHLAYGAFKEYFIDKILLHDVRFQYQNKEFEKYFVDVLLSQDKFVDVYVFLSRSLKEIVDSVPSASLKTDESFLGLVYLTRKWCDKILQLVLKYVDYQTDVNIKDIFDETALYFSADKGYLATVKFLVMERGADVNIKDRTGQTALHTAAAGAYLDTVKFLVEQGAEVDVADNFKYTPLYFAAASGHFEVVKFLVERGADINNKDNCNCAVVHSAIDGYNLNDVKFLIEQGANVNISNEFGWTPLHSAADRGCLDIVEFLVEQGADVNIRDNCDRTAEQYAAERGHWDITRFLVGGEANLQPRLRHDFWLDSVRIWFRRG